jgi:hypothetical protein
VEAQATREAAGLREVERDRAAREVLAYVAEYPGSDPFDIAVALDLDMDFVEDIAERLVREGRLTRGDHTFSEPGT